MSLVVAHCSEDALKIVSDTRLSDVRAGMPFGHFDGVLKVILLSPELGFAFAGDLGPALDALGVIHKDDVRKFDLDRLASVLLDSNKRSGNITDYLVFATAPAHRLAKIANGEIEESQSQYWIGDAAAFDEYQRHFHAAMARFPKHLRSHPEYVQNHMDEAMHEVIDSGAIQSVGDFFVPASSERGGLHYVSWARISFFPTLESSGDGWLKMRSGTAEEGSYTINMLTPQEFGIPALGFHFFEGRFGVFFAPRILDSPAIFRDVDVHGFAGAVLTAHGVRLQGTVRMG